MPTQGIAETECTFSLQSQEHVASNMHSGLVHFNGLDILVLGHLWADWETLDKSKLMKRSSLLSKKTTSYAKFQFRTK